MLTSEESYLESKEVIMAAESDLKASITIPTEWELVERVGWFIRLRWYAAAGVILGTLFAYYA